MPIYEYKCNDCGIEFESTQRMDEDPLTTCQECFGSVNRLISFNSFSLKGSGWYSDGYARGASEKKNGTKASGTKKAEKESSDTSGNSATKTLGKGKEK
jgi:putative FmdB family regulatory protein